MPRASRSVSRCHSVHADSAVLPSSGPYSLRHRLHCDRPIFCRGASGRDGVVRALATRRLLARATTQRPYTAARHRSHRPAHLELPPHHRRDRAGRPDHHEPTALERQPGRGSDPSSPADRASPCHSAPADRPQTWAACVLAWSAWTSLPTRSSVSDDVKTELIVLGVDSAPRSPRWRIGRLADLGIVLVIVAQTTPIIVWAVWCQIIAFKLDSYQCVAHLPLDSR